MSKKKIIFLVGPTGIGKSAVAISLAKKIKAEIISCDSMQVYRGMDIITSKADGAQRRTIRHHLLDVVKPCQEYNVARYRLEALAICHKLFKQEKIPLFVGGSGLYYSIIIDGLFLAVPEDKKIRVKLHKQLVSKGSSYLYKRLSRVDPLAARKIHPHDTRRIIRALEVYLKTGEQISFLHKQRKGLGSEYELKVFGLNCNRQELYRKIDSRVERMFSLGLVEEVKQLLKYKLSKTAICAIGISQLRDYFNGAHSLEQAKRLMQRSSRNYAKRQLTWFRKDKRIKWINISKTETSQAVAKRVYKLWKKLS